MRGLYVLWGGVYLVCVCSIYVCSMFVVYL